MRAVDGGFELDGEGPFPHVLLAPGHPGLARAAGARATIRASCTPTSRTSTPRGVAVVGAGMAAATEWLNALAAGAEVVSVRRREPARRPLNVAAAALLEARAGRIPRGRRATSARAPPLLSARPRTRPGAQWDEPVERAAREGRFRVEQALNGAEQVICATGFRRGFAHDPLLARLVAEHGLETDERLDRARATTRPCPALTDERRTLALAGVPGAVGLPGRRHARRA